MPRPVPSTFARLLAVPENRSAFVAMQELAADVVAGQPGRSTGLPVYLHGAPGTGKTSLVSALVEEVRGQRPEQVLAVFSASDWKMSASGEDPDRTLDERARACDLLVVEDLQHLPRSACENLTGILDDRLGRQAAVVLTGCRGPQALGLPARLASRLAGGLVVALESFGKASRLALLENRARRQLAVGQEVLAWLAEHLTSARQIEGTLASLEALARLSGRVPDVELVAAHFREQAEAARPTVERIVQRVGDHFRVEPRRLRSEHRGRHVLVPRQVGMYLARQLTGLSLEQIGNYFGGRDHSTVLHACRKVEEAMTRDPVLGGAVRQLHAELA